MSRLPAAARRYLSSKLSTLGFPSSFVAHLLVDSVNCARALTVCFISEWRGCVIISNLVQSNGTQGSLMESNRIQLNPKEPNENLVESNEIHQVIKPLPALDTRPAYMTALPNSDDTSFMIRPMKMRHRTWLTIFARKLWIIRTMKFHEFPVNNFLFISLCLEIHHRVIFFVGRFSFVLRNTLK